jgi:hypothetical protein
MSTPHVVTTEYVTPTKMLRKMLLLVTLMSKKSICFCIECNVEHHVGSIFLSIYSRVMLCQLVTVLVNDYNSYVHGTLRDRCTRYAPIDINQPVKKNLRERRFDIFSITTRSVEENKFCHSEFSNKNRKIHV